MTTKQVFIRQAVLEMLWIYQAQSNDVRWLQERDVNIWNEWEIDENGIWTADQLVPDGSGQLVKKQSTRISARNMLTQSAPLTAILLKNSK